MVRRKHRLSSNCPRCGIEGEDNQHLLLCKDPSVCEYRSSIFKEFSIWLDSMDTDPWITNVLISGLSNWFDGEPSNSAIDTLTSNLYSACALQLKIVWKSTLRGLICNALITCQQDVYTNITSRRTGFMWGSRLIQKLWNLIHLHWCHRCNILHKNSIADQLSGLKILQASVAHAYSTGLDTLPHVYAQCYNIPLQTLLKK